MALSDFLNGCRSVSLYSRYSLSSHSVCVAQKNVVLHKKLCCYVCPPKLSESQKICCGNKQNYVRPKRKRLMLTKYVYCCTEKEYMLTKKIRVGYKYMFD